MAFRASIRLAADARMRDRLAELAKIPPASISVEQLMSFGHPPLPQDALLASAELTRGQLPHRVARRVRAHESLPQEAQDNPFIKQIHDLYLDSFRNLDSWPKITSLKDNEGYSKHLASYLEAHAKNVSVLSRGFKEIAQKKLLSNEQLTAFLDKALRNRIGIRLIAEQHVALTKASTGEAQKQKGRRIGILDKALPVELVLDGSAAFVGVLCEDKYDRAPEIEIEGDLDCTFPYVEMHLSYIFTEILKNAFRATCEHHVDALDLPPVKAHISLEGSTLVVKIKDQGGGIRPEDLDRIWLYGFTTATVPPVDYRESGPYSMQQNAGAGEQDSPLAGQGFGLKLSRIYARYFGGGSLVVDSRYGEGTEVTIRLCQGQTQEH